MNCPTCRDLEQTYEAALGELCKGSFLGDVQIPSDVAASRNVDMERTKYEFGERRLGCVSASRAFAPPARAEHVYELERFVS